MYKSESIAALAGALSKAQAEIKAAEMNAVNPFLKNKYADLGAVIEAARPALSKHELSFTQLVGGDAQNITLDTILFHSSGEYIGTIISLPVGDEKGRSLAQSAGAIITYLRRYGLSAILGEYADEDADGNDGKVKTKPAQAEKPAEQGAAPKTNGKIGRPLLPAKLQAFMAEKAKKYAGKSASDKQVSLLAMMLDTVFAGDQDKRHTVQNYLFGNGSLKECPGEMILAGLDWVKPIQDSGGGYTPDLMATREAEAVYVEAIKDEGQTELF